MMNNQPNIIGSFSQRDKWKWSEQHEKCACEKNSTRIDTLQSHDQCQLQTQTSHTS